MGKKVSIADQLQKLGINPVEGMVRIAKKAEKSGKLALAGKMYSELTQYTAPKLKAIEHSIDADTREFLLTVEQRRNRIRQLAKETGVVAEIMDAEFTPLKHTPEEP